MLTGVSIDSKVAYAADVLWCMYTTMCTCVKFMADSQCWGVHSEQTVMHFGGRGSCSQRTLVHLSCMMTACTNCVLGATHAGNTLLRTCTCIQCTAQGERWGQKKMDMSIIVASMQTKYECIVTSSRTAGRQTLKGTTKRPR